MKVHVRSLLEPPLRYIRSTCHGEINSSYDCFVNLEIYRATMKFHFRKQHLLRARIHPDDESKKIWQFQEKMRVPRKDQSSQKRFQ